MTSNRLALCVLGLALLVPGMSARAQSCGFSLEVAISIASEKEYFLLNDAFEGGPSLAIMMCQGEGAGWDDITLIVDESEVWTETAPCSDGVYSASGDGYFMSWTAVSGSEIALRIPSDEYGLQDYVLDDAGIISMLRCRCTGNGGTQTKACTSITDCDGGATCRTGGTGGICQSV